MRAVLRTTFFVLLLANVLLVGYGQLRPAAVSSGAEPERLATQLAPEKIRIVSAGSPPPLAQTPPAGG